MISLKHIVGSATTSSVQSASTINGDSVGEKEKLSEITKPLQSTIVSLKHILTTGPQQQNSVEVGAVSAFQTETCENDTTAKQPSSIVSLKHILSTAPLQQHQSTVEMNAVTSSQETCENNEPKESVRIRPNSQFLTRFVGGVERFNDSTINKHDNPTEDVQLTCAFLLTALPLL